MENVLLYLPFLVVVAAAQFGERETWARYATFGLLVAINLGLLGLEAVALLNHFAKTFMPDWLEPQSMASDWLAVAAACMMTSILAFLPLIRAVRRWLARWLSIDPDSTVHTAALTFAVYQVGLSLGLAALIGDLENLLDAELSLTIGDVLLSGVSLTLFALLGVGLFIRRRGEDTLERLCLRRPTWKQLLAAIGITALLLGLDFGTNLLWQEVDPAGYDLLDRVTQNIFGSLITVPGALALGLSAGISEELLFRGAVQPRLGLLLAAVLFAVGHVQYGLTVATFEIFVIGLILGLVRNWTNTTVCILIHAGYNAAGVLLGMLQP
jgi:membrane protease YdiL (CAAX protease family)